VPSWKSPVAVGKKLVIRYAPLGLVGVIGPWNYPIANSFGDCIPAMMAGNTVILKPSEITPLSSLLMVEMLRDCGLPEDVFQVATGDGGTGAALIAEVDCVMFTGSSRTGKAVMKAAAEALVPCYLELGGKDPMIVCADANLERAANAAAFYSMNNGGQVCISVERCYVEESIYDEFVRKVTENVRGLRQGVPTDVGTVDVGAVIFPPQLDIIDEHVRDAVEKGAKVLTGGHPRSGPGRFYEPTVLVDVDHSMKCMQEETFGPTLPIMKIADAEEGVRLANDSVFGLQASVWTSDIDRGEALARRIEAGVVCVNDAQVNYTSLNLPMGGWKTSGIGTRHGANGIRKYTKIQSLLVTRRALKRELFMFPYTRRNTMMLRGLFKLLYGRGGRD
jgi:acyl-CoA reductase-like NAD-dependent aldehyde dehydrogenase